MDCDTKSHKNSVSFEIGVCEKGEGEPVGFLLDEEKHKELAQRYGSFINPTNAVQGSRYINNCMTLPACEGA